MLDRSSGEFSRAVFPPPSENQGGDGDGDFDIIMLRRLFYATDGRDGEPRIYTVFGETMKVYAISTAASGRWRRASRCGRPPVACQGTRTSSSASPISDWTS